MKRLLSGLFVLLIFAFAATQEVDRFPDSKQSFQALSPMKHLTESPGFDVRHYRLTFDFPYESSAYSGTSSIQILLTDPDQETIGLHMEDLTADVVTIDGAPVHFDQIENEILISLPDNVPDTSTVLIHYHGAPNRHGFYFHDRCAYTHSEPEEARAWFPCFDVPWDKATAEIMVTVPRGIEVASIGLLMSRTVDETRNTETFYWKTDIPVATYLFCLTMSDEYTTWSDWFVNQAGDSIEMPYYIFHDDVEKARIDVANMVDAMQIYTDLFGEYPFEKYGTAEVSPYHVGGMEHQSMTTVNKKWIQGDRSVEGGFVHELAHMWWGDAVTLSDWSHIWLNESFATYSEALFMEQFYGEDWYQGKVNYSRDTYLTRSKQSDFPIYDPPEGDLFNWGIIYNKGAVVLHMLRQELGDTVFFSILKNYYQKFQFGNASTDDFQAICETVSGRDLDWFFSQWIYNAAYPDLEYAWYGETLETGEIEILMRVDQVQNPERAPVFDFPLEVRLFSGDRIQDETVRIRQKSHTFSFRTPSQPDSIVLDPKKWTLMSATEIDDGPRLSDQVPEKFQLEQNFPNPFNGLTTIHFNVGDSQTESVVRLRIYDSQGRFVRELINRKLSPGAYWSGWDGRDENGLDVASGSYVIELTAPGFVQTRKTILTR